MRRRAKLIVPIALVALIAIAGLSMAADGGKPSSSPDRHLRGRQLPDRHFGFPGRPPFIDKDVADVLRQIHEAVAKKAPEISEPIIKRAQDAGDITSDQADELREAAKAIAQGKRPPEAGRRLELLRDPDVRKVIQDSFRAAAKQAPEIGKPIIDKALGEGKITKAQADEIRQKLQHVGERRGGPCFGRHGRRGPGHLGRPGFPPGPPPPGAPGIGPGALPGGGPPDPAVAS
jgi:hypothetical protein